MQQTKCSNFDWTRRRVGALLRQWCVFLPVLVQAASLEVRPVTVPAGAMAQIRVELGAPLAVSTGGISVALEEGMFGDIADVQMFSAAGDLLGTVELEGRRAVVKFSSVAGGVGRIGGCPVMTVTARVLGAVSEGAKGRVMVSALDWRDVAGEKFVVGDGVGMVTVGEAVVIEAVKRVGASTYKLTGRGFTAGSRVSGEGMAVEGVAFRSGTELEVTVAGENELTGRVFRVEGAEFVYAVRGEPDSKRSFLLPTQLFTSVGIQTPPSRGLPPRIEQLFQYGFLLENPHAEAVDVTAEIVDGASRLVGRKTFVLPARGAFFEPVARNLGFGYGGLLSSLPIRAAIVAGQSGPGLQKTVSSISFGYSGFRQPEQPFLVQPIGPMVFRQQVGDLGPTAQTVDLTSNLGTSEVLPSVVTTTEPWLTATATLQGSDRFRLSVRVEPGGMVPGDYMGSVVVTPRDTGYQPQSIPVRLEVRAGEFIRLSESAVALTSVPEGTITRPVAFLVRAGEARSVPITLRAETDDGGRWLTVSTSATTTPAGPDVQANPAGLRPGTYRGRIVVRGPINQEELAITFVVAAPVPLRLEALAPGALSLSFPVGGGTFVPDSHFQVTPGFEWIRLAVNTESGGEWLRAESGLSGTFTVIVNPRKLAAGIYRGSVRVSAPAAVNTLELPVTIRIWGGETEPIAVSPAVLTLTGRQRGTLVVTAAGGSLEVTATVEKQPEGCGLTAFGERTYGAPQVVTPAEVTVSCFGPPGQYEGSVRITAGSRSVVVPVSVVIPPLTYSGLVTPAVVNTVANGASNRVGAVAAGQYVALHGVGRERRVTFDELPAQVLFESLFQTNVVVPAGVRGRSSTTIRVGSGEAVTVAVEEAAPGLFTVDGTGVGQGAILNQDNGANSVERPAARGSVVQIFGTGEGTAQEVWVMIGGVEATVVYAGSTVTGLFQVNAVVPEGAASGAAVPVTLQVGRFRAQGGVTMAVR